MKAVVFENGEVRVADVLAIFKQGEAVKDELHTFNSENDEFASQQR